MVESSTVENLEGNVQPPLINGARDSYSVVSMESPLLSTDVCPENKVSLTETDLDGAVNVTDDFLIELPPQEQTLKPKDTEKQIQEQIKTENNRDTTVKPYNSVDKTVGSSLQNANSKDLEQKDEETEINIDTVNPDRKSSTDTTTNVDVVTSKPSTNGTIKNAEDTSSVKEPRGVDVDNIPIKKNKKGRKKKTVNKKGRISSNSAGATDLSKQTTLDSILIGIEEYLQDDDLKNEDIKVNVIRGELADVQSSHSQKDKVPYGDLSEKRLDVQETDTETFSESAQKIFSINEINKDHIDEASLKDQNDVSMDKIEHAISEEGNAILYSGGENEASAGHKQEPHSLKENDENVPASTTEYLLQGKTKDAERRSLAKSEFHFNVGESEPLTSREVKQTESVKDSTTPLILAREDKEVEVSEEKHILEQKAKQDHETVTANHENDKNDDTETVNSNTILTLEGDKQKVNIDGIPNPIMCTSDNEKNVEHSTDTSLNVEKEEKLALPEVGKKSAIEKPEAIKDNEETSIEEGSTPKIKETIDDNKMQSEMADGFPNYELEGNAKPAIIPEESSNLGNNPETSPQESKRNEGATPELTRESMKGEDGGIAEVVENDRILDAFETTEEDLKSIKQDKEDRDTSVHGYIGDLEDDTIASGIKTIKEDIKTKQDGIVEPLEVKIESEDSAAAREVFATVEKGATVEKSNVAECPQVVKKLGDSISERFEDIQITKEKEEEIPKEDTKDQDAEVGEVLKEESTTDISRAVGSSKEEYRSQNVKVSTEEVETTQKDIEDATPKNLEITQKGNEMIKKNAESKDGGVTETVNEGSKVKDAGTDEKNIKNNKKIAKGDIKRNLEMEASKADEAKTRPKALEIIARRDEENEEVETAQISGEEAYMGGNEPSGTTNEDSKAEYSKTAEILEDTRNCLKAEVPKEDTETATKKDAAEDGASPANILKGDTTEHNYKDIKVSDEHEKTVELPELARQEKMLLKGDNEEMRTEENEKMNFIPDLTMEETIVEDIGKRETETEQEGQEEEGEDEEGTCQLDFNDTESINIEGPGNEENESEDQKTNEDSKEPTADDILKDILDETDEFLEQLKIVDDSEINALLQSLDAKDTATQTAKQPIQDQPKPQDVIKTSEIRTMNEQEPVYIYTSLAGGGFHMIPRTNRLSTILTANRIPFTYRDLGTDDEARKVWKTFSKGRSLPGVVRGHNDLIGNWEDIEEANEDYRLRELIYDII